MSLGGGSTPSRIQGFGLAGAMAALLLPSSAGAEIVRLNNGLALAVETARFEGRPVVLSRPGGQEIRVARELVHEPGPDHTNAQHPALDRSAIRRLVDQVAARVGLDRRLAHAVVHTESNYQPFAVSPKGAVGLRATHPGGYSIVRNHVAPAASHFGWREV